MMHRWHIVKTTAQGYGNGAVIESFDALPDARYRLLRAYSIHASYGARMLDQDTLIVGLATYRVVKTSTVRALNIPNGQEN